MQPSESAPDAYREIRELASTVARERYAPKAAAWDAARTRFPNEERDYLGELGFLGSRCPSGTAGPAPR